MKMKNEIRYSSLVLLLLLLCVGCGQEDKSVLGTGSFEATEILVSGEVSGKLIRWDLSEGDRLEEGAEVGLVDTVQLALKREALRRSGAGVAVASPNIETQTAPLEAKLSDLRSQRDRVKRLLDADVATKKQLDDLDAGIAQLEGQLEATRSTLSGSRGQLSAQRSAIDVQREQVSDMIRRSVIKSPISGTVIANYVHPGELAAAGHPLFRIADLDEMILRVYITGEDLGLLRVGEKVKVRVDGGSGEEATRTYDGTISWISPKAEFTPKSVQTREDRAGLVYAVKVMVPNEDGQLKIGMYGELLRPAAE